MKVRHSLQLAVVFSLLTCICGSVLAHHTSDAPNGGSTMHHHHWSEACLVIFQACKTSGFIEGDRQQGKGLADNCFRVIMNPKHHPKVATAQGLSLPVISSDQINACKATVLAR